MEKKIFKLIQKYHTIVVARHIGPDPDAIASELALRDSIRLTFPDKNVYAVGLGVAKFKEYGSLDKSPEIKEDSLLIVVDVPNIARIDGVNFSDFKDVIKLDHHPLEDKMGKCEIIDEKASSAAEIIANLIFNTKLKMDENVASNLFLGIASDSDRFLLPTTTPKTFNVVSKLINDYHLDLKRLYNILYERPVSEFKFQAFLALNMTITENGFAYMKITSEMVKEYNVDSGTASNLVNNFNYLKGIYSWAFVTYDERAEIYKVNIRSRGPIINAIAAKYNGGGHKYAAGARIKNEDDVDKLFYDLNEACREYIQNNNLEGK